jgi:Type I restriction enzyme R protein N terminus (HSDR_N)
MATIPKRVGERLTAGIKRYQPILVAAKARDVGETDTVTIIKDMLADIFGYDKYTELTSEFSIRGTYCDLAIKLDGKLSTLIEVKAIGIDLKEAHTKQAIDYAANQGVDWVLLTNGVRWCVYHVIFSRPIQQELVVDIDFSSVSPKSEQDLDTLFLWCKEGWVKSALGEFHSQKQALSRFFLGAMVLSDPVVEVIRRELRRMSPDIRVDLEQIRNVLTNEVLKRDVLEGEKADEARKKVARSAGKSLRSSNTKQEESSTQAAEKPATSDTANPSESPTPNQNPC